MEQLLFEIQTFKTWAMELSGDGMSSQLTGEWECNYPAWNAIYTAFSNVLSTIAVQDVQEDVRMELVYIIARDNECQWLIHEVIQYPQWLEALCQCSLERSDEPDAKWQLAYGLAKCPSSANAKAYVLRFVEDAHEYVSRRAFMALPVLFPEKIADYAPLFWDRDCYGMELQEYQRMAVLEALYQIQSPLLDCYMDKARQSKQAYLIDFSNQLRGQA